MKLVSLCDEFIEPNIKREKSVCLCEDFESSSFNILETLV